MQSIPKKSHTMHTMTNSIIAKIVLRGSYGTGVYVKEGHNFHLTYSLISGMSMNIHHQGIDERGCCGSVDKTTDSQS